MSAGPRGCDGIPERPSCKYAIFNVRSKEDINQINVQHGTTTITVETGMLTRPAGHEAKAEARKSEAKD